MRYDDPPPQACPFGDKFMMAAGHSVPTCYALWMVLYQAMARQYELTQDARYDVDPEIAMLPIDAIGFRRGANAMATILKDNNLTDHPIFAQAKVRGIKAGADHAESVDVTNDVNGGPSGVGVATSAGKAAFWDIAGREINANSPKIVAFEGEFAMTEGHAQELKTQALEPGRGQAPARHSVGQQCPSIDDSLLGGVIPKRNTGYNIAEQWTSYGWNVIRVADGGDYGQITAAHGRDGKLGCRGPAADDRHRQDHQELLARRQPTASSTNTVKQVARLSEPSLRL